MRRLGPAVGDLERLGTLHRSSYDRLAPRYAITNAEMPCAVREAAKQFLALLSPGGRLLDLGCGHGRDAAWFAARGAAVAGMDLSAGMLAEGAACLGGVLSQADMRRLPIRTATFDGVWSNAAMLHLPKAHLPGALSEIRRVLRPDGAVFISVQVGQGEAWESVSYGLPLRRFFVRYSAAEFAEAVGRAGLTVLKVEETAGAPRRHWAHVYGRRD